MTLNDELKRALQLHRQNRLAEAEKFYQSVLNRQPRDFEALNYFAMLKLQRGQVDDALRLIAAALTVQPTSAIAHSHHGVALAAAGRCDEAIAAYDKALAIEPRFADAFCNRGNALYDLNRFAAALSAHDAALSIRPKFSDALVGRGLALRALGRPAEAVLSLEKAVAMAPDNPDALNNLGVTLRDLERHNEALDSFSRAAAVNPDFVEAHFNRGNTLMKLRRPAEALVSYGRAVSLRPNAADFHNGRGNAFTELHRADEALASYQQALALDAKHIPALLNRANLFLKLRRIGEAEDAYRALQEVAPDHAYVLNGLVFCQLFTCDWRELDTLSKLLLTHAEERSWTVEPGLLHSLPATPAEQNHFSQIWVRTEVGTPPQPFRHPRAAKADKLRIAYVSADFRRHPVSELMVGLIECRDRNRCEALGISIGPDDRSDLRARVVRAFDAFHDVTSRTDEDVARLLHKLGVHIAVDLTGYHELSRPRIFAMRPAPIQVSYLGFSGPMGSPHIDYVIGDRTVTPAEHQPFYTEQIVQLPDCYLASDPKKPLPAREFSRSECGLPENGFVFCCFNNAYKLSETIFDVWMRLLQAVEGSVLWLSQANSLATENLRKGAADRGVSPERLIFAPRMPQLADHFARHRAADLFLDTLPYNAHTTANDALWSGLPVLTCLGSSFAGRVGASQLRAAGLPELVTATLDEYEALALALAADPARLAGLRSKLAENRATCALFDTNRYCRHIEAAFATMWSIRERGEAPCGFAVSPLS